MKFSIVVPAYNEAESIHVSIDALQDQTVPREDYEIIVVDNNSKDGTAEAARRARADRVVIETTQGTNFARQRGFVESRGDIIAFLDADCQPPRDWLEKIAADLSLPGVAAVSGPFDYGFTGMQKVLDRWYTTELLPRLSVILKALFGRPAGVMIGGNFAVWRKTLNAIGGLPPLAFWGDDAATAMLISRKAGKVVFDPKLLVKSSPRRFERGGFFRLALRYAGAYLSAYFNPQFR